MTPPTASSPPRPPRRSAFGPSGESGAGAHAGLTGGADADLAGGADADLSVIVPAAIVRVDGLPAPAARAAARSGEIEMLPVGPEAWLAVSADLGPEAVRAAIEAAEATGMAAAVEAAGAGTAAAGTAEMGAAGAGAAGTETVGTGTTGAGTETAGTGAAGTGTAGAGTAETGTAGAAGAGGGGAASCTDLTHARTVLRVSGPHARARLARGCPLDLDTLEVGGDGDGGAATATTAVADTAPAAAATLLGPFEVVIRRVPSAPASFDVFVPRSMARSAREWLAAPVPAATV